MLRSTSMHACMHGVTALGMECAICSFPISQKIASSGLSRTGKTNAYCMIHAASVLCFFCPHDEERSTYSCLVYFSRRYNSHSNSNSRVSIGCVCMCVCVCAAYRANEQYRTDSRLWGVRVTLIFLSFVCKQCTERGVCHHNCHNVISVFIDYDDRRSETPQIV